MSVSEGRATAVEPAPRGRNPFDESGVVRDARGVARYEGRPSSLVEMLRASVDRDASAVVLLEVGGPSLTYGELWDRSAAVAVRSPDDRARHSSYLEYKLFSLSK